MHGLKSDGAGGVINEGAGLGTVSGCERGRVARVALVTNTCLVLDEWGWEGLDGRRRRRVAGSTAGGDNGGYLDSNSDPRLFPWDLWIGMEEVGAILAAASEEGDLLASEAVI